MELSNYTKALLSDIESRIISEVEEDFTDQWKSFWNEEVNDIIFTPKRKIISKPSAELKNININDAVEDLDLMLAMQLEGVSRALGSTDSALSVRANYGTGIMTSVFGAEFFLMPYEQNTLPTTIPVGDDKVLKIVSKGIPSIYEGLGQKVFDFGELCREVFESYPKIKKYVTVYPPDTQGPLDIADLLWGSDIFYALYDDPDLVHSLMKLVTDTYKVFLDKWFEMYPNRPDINVHWDYFTKGTICLRNDSAINLSADQYAEFALPYDKHLLEYYGGGMLHYCGKGDHFVGLITDCDCLYGVNLSQPHLNDMNKVYAETLSKGKKLLDLTPAACKEYENRPDARTGMIFCKSL